MNFRRLIDVPWRRRTQKGVGLRRSKIRSPSAALCSRQANPVHESSQYNSISQGGAALRRASRSILERAEQRELSDKLIPTDPRAAARCGMGFRGAQFRGDGEPAVVLFMFPANTGDAPGSSLTDSSTSPDRTAQLETRGTLP